MLNKLAIYDEFRSIVHNYLNKRECSVQECVYHILSGKWLGKTYPWVTIENSHVPEKRFQICLSKDEISLLPDHPTIPFKRNMLDRYIDRLNRSYANGKYLVLDSFCYPEFLRYYYLAQA